MIQTDWITLRKGITMATKIITRSVAGLEFRLIAGPQFDEYAIQEVWEAHYLGMTLTVTLPTGLASPTYTLWSGAGYHAGGGLAQDMSEAVSKAMAKAAQSPFAVAIR